MNNEGQCQPISVTKIRQNTRSEEREGLAARSIVEEQESSWFKKPFLPRRGDFLFL